MSQTLKIDFLSIKRHWLCQTLCRYDTAAFLGCIGFFIIWPNFDLKVSSLFYNKETTVFFWKHHIIADFIYSLTHLIGTILIVGLPLLIALSWIIKRDYLIKTRPILIFLLCACILGPVLMVNAVLKDNWGRPRPHQVLEFGGDRPYQAAFYPTFENREGHSFVSGHASVGFVFFSLALLARNRRWLLLPVLAGGVIGAGRIVQGGHFFSDVIFSGWVVWYCSILLFTVFYKLKLFPETILASE